MYESEKERKGRAGGCHPSFPFPPLSPPPVLPTQIRQSLCGGGGAGEAEEREGVGGGCGRGGRGPCVCPICPSLRHPPPTLLQSYGLADTGFLIQTSKIKQLRAGSGSSSCGAMLTPCDARSPSPTSASAPYSVTHPSLLNTSSQCVTAVSYTPQKEATSVIW